MKAMKGQRRYTNTVSTVVAIESCYTIESLFFTRVIPNGYVLDRHERYRKWRDDLRDARQPKFATRHFRHFKLKPASQHRAFKFQHGGTDLRIPSLRAKAHPFQHNRPVAPRRDVERID